MGIPNPKPLWVLGVTPPPMQVGRVCPPPTSLSRISSGADFKLEFYFGADGVFPCAVLWWGRGDPMPHQAFLCSPWRGKLIRFS